MHCKLHDGCVKCRGLTTYIVRETYKPMASDKAIVLYFIIKAFQLYSTLFNNI